MRQLKKIASFISIFACSALLMSGCFQQKEYSFQESKNKEDVIYKDGETHNKELLDQFVEQYKKEDEKTLRFISYNTKNQPVVLDMVSKKEKETYTIHFKLDYSWTEPIPKNRDRVTFMTCDTLEKTTKENNTEYALKHCKNEKEKVDRITFLRTNKK